jgi:hypothetical protein
MTEFYRYAVYPNRLGGVRASRVSHWAFIRGITNSFALAAGAGRR